ncbi:phytanoyl-CoA dioxygenase family protein [Paenibacillus periandrae]|uniref:phytanoyl-CoA dioxygenase family protein n=1 Tax=Paenibacillus periandrae TaxID=1761741 RepID=UPI001F090BCA|nr:phytanoyl-CoA dioxygenase family protein [Paenibacillus periandrae]
MKKVAYLTNDQLKSYNDNGYLVLRKVFSEQEAAVWRQDSERLLSLNEYLDPNNLRVGYRKIEERSIIEKIDPVQDLSAVFHGLVNDERILSPLRDIYQDEPTLFKDKLIYKLPGVTGYTMHQDASWWQGFPIEGLISVMVAIDGASKENGGLELFPGYHSKFRSTPGELRNMNAEEIAEIDSAKGQIVETEPGDIIIFHSFTPHQSGPNTANVSRRQLYLTYSPAKNGQLYKAHYQHYCRYVTNLRSNTDPNELYFK